MPEDPPTNWRQAELAYLDALIQLVREYYEHWGQWPTPEQLRALMKDF